MAASISYGGVLGSDGEGEEGGGKERERRGGGE